ncbi:MAG TPA: outer membrane beta-barrel protein [Candidatus Acidoferrum sp.]|nr:outer membrane beta-barrel protein [Candidatus Acidoferrum sp.]
MKIGSILFLGFITLLFASLPAKAQGRFEVTPFVGYETSGSYPISVFSNTGNAVPVNRLQVNDALSFGTFLDFNLTENAQLEFMWDRNNTSFNARNALSGQYFKAFNSDVDQFQFGGLYMLLNSEHRLRPYVAASLGFTYDDNFNGTPNRTEFAYSLGGGLKYFVNRHVGLRGDIRYMPTYGNSSYGTYCDPFYGCYSAKSANYLNRGNFVGGIIFKF